MEVASQKRLLPAVAGVGVVICHLLIGVLTARQHRKVNLCQLREKETGSVG